MSPGPNDNSFDASQYQHPQQTWVCEHHSEGKPCAIGPSGSGECIVAQICSPTHDGTSWQCTRARAWGGKCAEGPVPDPNQPNQIARCPHHPGTCTPRRSLRRKRQLLSACVAAITLGFCLIIVGGGSGSGSHSAAGTTTIVSPGPLTSSHASLTQGCVACHASAEESPLNLLACAFGQKDELGDSHRCLHCHQELGEHATHPHSVSPAIMERAQHRNDMPDAPHTPRQQLARFLSPPPVSTSGEMACSRCHTEHRGDDFDLKSMSNAQCQSCHGTTFHSLADGHPEFSAKKRAYLYFDHSTHLNQHFGKTADERGNGDSSHTMTCNDCHIQDTAGASMVLASFEETCARCHLKQITDDHMPPALRLKGTAFFTFPPNSGEEEPSDGDETDTADADTTKRNHEASRTGHKFLPPFMEVLLAAGNTMESAQDVLSEPKTSSEADLATRTFDRQSVKALTDDLLQNRTLAVQKRFSLILADSDIRPDLTTDVIARLDESGFFPALQLAADRWSSSSERHGTDTERLTGAWSISQDGSSLLYRSRGHADPLLRDWISFAAAASSQYPDAPAPGDSGAFDRLLQQLAAPETTGRCLKCHTVDAQSNGVTTVNWKSRQIPTQQNGFTKFAHGPHVTLLNNEQQKWTTADTGNSQCETCHSVRELSTQPRKFEFLLEDWMPNPDFNHTVSIGINPVRRDSCVTCHTPERAGNSCLQCHNYHVHPDRLNER